MFSRCGRASTSIIRTISILLFWGLIFAPLASSGERTAKEGDEVEIHYVGKLQNNEIFDKSEGRGPLKFTVGSKNIIVGMNKAVVGMKVGQTKTVSVPPKEAYGEYNDGMVFRVKTKQLPEGAKPGAKLTTSKGQMVTVKKIVEDTATLDANHFLAGKTLIFEITLLSIK